MVTVAAVVLVGLMVDAISNDVKERVEPVRVEYVIVLVLILVKIELRILIIVVISICTGQLKNYGKQHIISNKR